MEFGAPAAPARVYRFDPARQVFQAYPLPQPGAGAALLALDPQGWPWFSEMLLDQVSRLDPDTGQVHRWRPPASDRPAQRRLPFGLAFDG